MNFYQRLNVSNVSNFNSTSFTINDDLAELIEIHCSENGIEIDHDLIGHCVEVLRDAIEADEDCLSLEFWFDRG